MHRLWQLDGEQDEEPDDPVPLDEPEEPPELDPDEDPDVIGATHVPPMHVWPTIVQFWHASPPVPHAVSPDPVWQPPLGSQQPPPQF